MWTHFFSLGRHDVHRHLHKEWESVEMVLAYGKFQLVFLINSCSPCPDGQSDDSTINAFACVNCFALNCIAGTAGHWELGIRSSRCHRLSHSRFDLINSDTPTSCVRTARDSYKFVTRVPCDVCHVVGLHKKHPRNCRWFFPAQPSVTPLTRSQPVMFASQSSHSLMCVTLWPSSPLRSSRFICVLDTCLLLAVLFKFFFHVLIPAVGYALSFLCVFVAIFRAVGYALVPLVACFVSCTALHHSFHVLLVAALLLSFTTVSAPTLMTTCLRSCRARHRRRVRHCSTLGDYILTLVPRALFATSVPRVQKALSWRRRAISVKTITEMRGSVFIPFEFFFICNDCNLMRFHFF